MNSLDGASSQDQVIIVELDASDEEPDVQELELYEPGLQKPAVQALARREPHPLQKSNDELLLLLLSGKEPVLLLKQTAPKLYCALDLHNAQASSKGLALGKIAFGDAVLDKVFDGGISVPGLTEISGSSSSGKTQLALQLCITAQIQCFKTNRLSGYSVVYLCTDQKFPFQRLAQLLKVFCVQYPQIDFSSFTDQIYIHTLYNLKLQVAFISYALEPWLLGSTRNVRLVIVDSVAGNARSHFPSAALAGLQFKMAAALKALSAKYNLAVLCINQVSDCFSSSPEQLSNNSPSLANKGFDCVPASNYNLMAFGAGSDFAPGFTSVPALGLNWSYCIDTRVFLVRFPGSALRKLYIVFSPTLKNAFAYFSISSDGLFGLSNPFD